METQGDTLKSGFDRQIWEMRDALTDSRIPIIEYIVRPLPRRSFTFGWDEYPPTACREVEKNIQERFEHLQNECRQEKRKVSGKDRQEIREQEWQRPYRTVLQQRLEYELWKQSERTLNILRTKGFYPLPQGVALAEKLIKFQTELDVNKFPEFHETSPLYIGPDKEHQHAMEQLIPGTYCDLSPNEFYRQVYPQVVRDYGFPFFTTVNSRLPLSDQLNPKKELPAGINTNFFAALLGGDKRLAHDVVYFVPEGRFYFFDLAVDRYIPTTEEKVRFYLTQILQDLAWGKELEEAQMILERFCTRNILEGIIEKAKAVLAAERGFFVGPGSNPRLTAEHQKDEQITSTVRNFIKDDVQKDEAGILTVTECLARFQFVADEAEIELPVPKVLKSLVQKAVQELHQKGLRHDLVLPDGRCVIGWKGLRLRREVENAAETWTEIKQLAESGRSEDSAETNLFITLPEMDPTIASATRN